MVTISDAAAEKAKEILTAEGKTGWGLRIYTANGGCSGPSYGMDIDEHPGEGDEVFEKNGLRVFIDRSASEDMDGMEIDFVDEQERKGFILTGTPPSSSCDTCGGC